MTNEKEEWWQAGRGTQLALPAPVNPEFLTVKEVAERWGMTEKHVRRQIDRGRLKAHRFGNEEADRQHLRISYADLMEYEQRQRDE